MMRLAIAATAIALCGCGATLTASDSAPPRKPPPRPTKQDPACRLPTTTPKPSTATPSQALLDALAVLRRPKTAEDTPPAGVFRHYPVRGGLMVDAVRRVRSTAGAELWLVPVEDLSPPLEVPEACLRSMPPDQRKATREAIRRSRTDGKTEGVALLKGAGPGVAQIWRDEDILAGRAYVARGCMGEMHDRIAITGLVPDAVTQVTMTTRSGAIVQSTPEQNVVLIDQPRPDKPSGLPAHVTSTTAGAPLEFDFDPRMTKGLDQPCEPPSRQSIGQRREPATRLDLPPSARIELQTSRWQPEDTGPQVAGATYRERGRRCLLIAPERDLREGKRAHRFCVEDAKLRAERFIVRATRLPSGDVVLEGFADPDQISWITVERSIGPGAFRLPLARRSGAFFVAIDGRHPSGGSFKLHAARRGAPVRYTGMRTVRLRPSGG
jgi:hypothetical protein